MNRDISFKLLRIAYSGMRTIQNRPDRDAASMGRDIYDIVSLHTTDAELRYQMEECRASGMNRPQCLLHLDKTFNIGFF